MADGWRRIGECGVDSGTLIVQDPIYDQPELYTAPTDGVLIEGFGGDGCYPVYEYVLAGHTRYVVIDFASNGMQEFKSHLIAGTLAGEPHDHQLRDEQDIEAIRTRYGDEPLRDP